MKIDQLYNNIKSQYHDRVTGGNVASKYSNATKRKDSATIPALSYLNFNMTIANEFHEN